jgi:hypothetical protein
MKMIGVFYLVSFVTVSLGLKRVYYGAVIGMGGYYRAVIGMGGY